MRWQAVALIVVLFFSTDGLAVQRDLTLRFFSPNITAHAKRHEGMYTTWQAPAAP